MYENLYTVEFKITNGHIRFNSIPFTSVIDHAPQNGKQSKERAISTVDQQNDTTEYEHIQTHSMQAKRTTVIRSERILFKSTTKYIFLILWPVAKFARFECSARV